MKKIFILIFLLLSSVIAEGAPPSRIFTYVEGAKVKPDEVTANEDAIFTYLIRGVDTFASALTTDNILDGTITNIDISGTAAITYGKLSLSNSILNADISASAGIVDSKLATISTAGKVSGAALTSLANIPSGAGNVPSANLPGGGVTLPTGAIFFMVTGSCPTGTTDVTTTYSNKFVRINATGGSTGGADTDSITLTTTELPAHTHSISGYADTGGSAAVTIQTNLTSASVNTGSAGSGAAFTVDTVPAYVTAKCCQVN